MSQLEKSFSLFNIIFEKITITMHFKELIIQLSKCLI